jgi:hypothetical protein
LCSRLTVSRPLLKPPSADFGNPLSAIERPGCPTCHTRMLAASTAPGTSGYDYRTFECAKCDHVHMSLVASDPMKSDAQGWLAGELRSPI